MKQEERFEILRSFSKIHRIPGLQAKAQNSLHMLCETMDVSFGKLLLVSGDNVSPWYVYDKSTQTFITDRVRQVEFHKAEFSKQREGTRSISGHVAATGQLIIIPDVENYEKKDYFASLYFEKNKIRSEIVVPVYYQNEIRWVLCLSSEAPKHFVPNQKDFYEVVGTFLSSLLAEAFDSEENAIEHKFDGLVLEVWNTRHQLGHRNSIRNFLQSLANQLSLIRGAIYLVCPGENVDIVLYAGYPGNCEKLVVKNPKKEGFVYDEDSQYWKPDPKLEQYHLRDHEMKVIGYYVAQVQQSLHLDLLRNLFKRFSTETEALLEEERSLRASKLRNKIIMYEKAEQLKLVDRFQDLRKLVIDECKFGDIQLWIVDDKDKSLAYLSGGNNSYELKKDEECLVAKVWRGKRAIFLYETNEQDKIVNFAELNPKGIRSWIGFPLLRGGEIIGIISCIGDGENILTVQDIPAVETIAMVLTVEMELQKTYRELLRSRFIESHQISAHLHNAISRVSILWQVANKDVPSLHARLITHLRNIKAFLRLAIRSLNLEGRPIEEITDFNPMYGSLTACVAETVSMVRALLHSQKRDVKIYYDEFQAHGMFDYLSLQEALLAVLLNAAKYSGSEQPIEISYSDVPYARLEIKNVGIGIPFTETEVIFDRGRQGSNVTSEMALDFEKVSMGHRGLGLFVAKQMMKRTGGDIRVKSPGKCFSWAELLSMKWKDIKFSDADYTIFEIVLPRGS